MLKNILVLFSTLFAGVYCSGELAVISTPDSVVLKQTNVPLDCAAVGSMMSACAGNSIVESSNLKFAYITDPFNTAEITFLISLSGANKINYSPTKPMLFTVREDKCSDSLASTMERFEEDGSTVLDLDLSGGLQNLEQYEHILGKLNVNIDNVECALSANDNAQRQVLEQLAKLDAISGALSTSMAPPALIHIRLSFGPILSHSNVYNEAVRCYVNKTTKIAEIMTKAFGKNKVMVLSYVTKEDEPKVEHKRARRATETTDDEDLNLAKVYDDNYPVIFNIILWFGVVIAFSLYAISYAIATMDPGRDSIIYRMTSTRIKKDN